MKEAIILAGGLGTRLQTVVADRPKCMALVADKPFLEYLFNFFEKHQFQHIILSLGYKYEVVLNWLATQNYSFEISYTIEKEPLGTGGAIKYATTKLKGDTFFVFNGDTFFDVNIDVIIDFHQTNKVDITLALKPMTNFDRYGSVVTDITSKVIKFQEKQYITKGLINGGVYLVNKSVFDHFDLRSERFSFEKDVLEAKLHQVNIYGFIEDSYFIDIGIPSDYDKANTDFRLF